MIDDDEIKFAEETAEAETPSHFWQILIVDDEPDVHATTELALREAVILDKRLEFLHAYTGQEALRVLSEHGQDIAVILLDVVMERDNSGLEVARQIREVLDLHDIRIILRTGHPGYAPEYQVIREYAINDYQNKAELTQGRLLTVMTSAIRSYEQIRALNRSRRGLELIIQASQVLFERRSLDSFTNSVLHQISALLATHPQGLLCMHSLRMENHKAFHEWVIVAASGDLSHLVNHPLANLNNPEAINAIEHAIRTRSSMYQLHYTVLYLKRPGDEDAAIFLETGEPLDEYQRQLLEVYCSNVAIGLDNLTLFRQLQDLAYVDPLCHISNRTQFVARLNQLLAAPEKRLIALIDINQFSQVNDALGHLIGDQLILSVVQRLRPQLPDDVALARVGVDVFALAGNFTENQLMAILATFDKPFPVASHMLRIQVTAACARLIDTEQSGIGCLKDVTIALNQAKQNRHQRLMWYSNAMTRASRLRLNLLHDLESAINNRLLTVYYQPQVNLATRQIVGVEALVRWPQPDGGFIGPDQFIPLAEQSGLIIDLGDYVIDCVCRQMKQWQAEGFDELRMAINVSMIQFNHSGLIPKLQARISEMAIDPSRIEVEITESVAMQNPDLVISTIDRLKAMGIRLAIDDFGTGFSSLAYLQRLKADRLKIDRAFVRNMGLDSHDNSIAEMVINLGHKLGISVIAEGIEFPQQASILHSLGCDEGQGYLFAKPSPPQTLTAWMRENSGGLMR